MSRPPAAPRRPATPRQGARGAGSHPGRGRTTGTSKRPGTPTGRGRTTGAGRSATAERSGTPAKGTGSGDGSRGNRRLAISTPDGDRPLLTLRALALVLVLLVAFAIVAPTARHALVQQEQLRSTEEQLAAAQEEEQRLTDELALWDDPEYVQAQARDRLGYTMPGQTPFVVVDPETLTGGLSAEEEEAAEREEALEASRPWYLNLQESVEEAGAIPGHGPSSGDAPADDVPEPDLPPETPSETELPSTETLQD
ncbi:MAG: FtsB family cell division protein [Actinomycetaceae bacterium]